jgi:hypothetical protein
MNSFFSCTTYVFNFLHTAKLISIVAPYERFSLYIYRLLILRARIIAALKINLIINLFHCSEQPLLLFGRAIYIPFGRLRVRRFGLVK